MENHKKIEKFFYENKGKIKNPLIQGFLSDPDNLSLLEQYIIVSSYENKSKVDEAFQKHYENVRQIKYLDNLIYFFSIDFDKKIRRQKDRHLLILDKNTSYDNKTIRKESIPSNSKEMQLCENSLLDNVENETLIKALKTLTIKQLSILNLIYVQELPLKEISIQLGTTPQNVSNLHRKALKKLKLFLNNNEEGEYEKEKQ